MREKKTKTWENFINNCWVARHVHYYTLPSTIFTRSNRRWTHTFSQISCATKPLGLSTQRFFSSNPKKIFEICCLIITIWNRFNGEPLSETEKKTIAEIFSDIVTRLNVKGKIREKNSQFLARIDATTWTFLLILIWKWLYHIDVFIDIKKAMVSRLNQLVWRGKKWSIKMIKPAKSSFKIEKKRSQNCSQIAR